MISRGLPRGMLIRPSFMLFYDSGDNQLNFHATLELFSQFFLSLIILNIYNKMALNKSLG
jgi:hypothetical protein